MPEYDPLPLENENAKAKLPDYDSLRKEDGLATLSWYLVATGIGMLALAAVCLYLDHAGYRDFFKHKDFALNPRALSRYLLLAGIVAYGAGRSITYYRRFRKRASG